MPGPPCGITSYRNNRHTPNDSEKKQRTETAIRVGALVGYLTFVTQSSVRRRCGDRIDRNTAAIENDLAFAKRE